jgi:gliding motility-associated-like protein
VARFLKLDDSVFLEPMLFQILMPFLYMKPKGIGLLIALLCSLLTFLTAPLVAQTVVNANDDAAATFMNTTITLLVLNNDVGSNISMQIVVQPAHGTASVNVGNTISYIPTASYIGNDYFTYRITDTQTGNSDIANVNITVQESPLAAVTAIDDVAQTIMNNAIEIAVLGNDIGTGISLTAIASLPQHGDVVLNTANNTIIYTPDENFTGIDDFTYLIGGGGGASDIGNVSVSVIEASADNNPPYAVVLEYCAAPMQPVIICNEFFDPEGHDTHVDVNASTTTFHCSLNTVNNSDSCLRYTPLPGFFGNDTVHIVVCDNQTPPACSESIAIIHVNAGGCTQPTAINDNATIGNGIIALNGITMPADNPYLGAMLGILNNDENLCGGIDQLTVSSIINMPDNGIAQIVAGQILYDPNTNFSGTDILQYVTCNACGLCDTATLTINVNAQNTETCEIHDNLCIAPYTTTEICPEFCTFTAVNIAELDIINSEGIVQNAANSTCINYIPPTISSGITTISFTACNNSNTICETYVMHLTIDAACGDNAPIAENDNANAIIGQSTVVDVLQNDTDPEGQALTLTNIIANPTCGSAEIVANQIVFFTANDCPDVANISYVVCDETNLCDTAYLFININGIIDDCENQTEYCTVPFDPSELSYLQICANFCDLGPTAHITDANTTFHCSISLLNDTCFTYLPLPGFTGTDQIEAYACNDSGLCDTLTFTVHVGCTVPTALNDNGTTITGQSITLTPLSNDSDACGNTLTPSITTGAQHGNIVINPDNTFTYTPNEGYVGTENITYTVCTPCSSGQTCDDAHIIIAVTPIEGSQTPIAQDDTQLTEINQAIEISILQNDYDPDNSNDELSVQIITQPDFATATLTINNTIIYEPNSDYEGADAFTYSICDPSGECDTATVNINVSPSINAQPDIIYIAQGQIANIYVMNNDEGINITVTGVQNMPDYGAITNADAQTGLFTYQPQPDFVGTDYFTYTICNDTGNCETSLVSIIVINPDLENVAPIATNDYAQITLASPQNIYPLWNDSDANSDNILISSLYTQPINGTAQIDPSGQYITYTPNVSTPYCDNFAYIVCDNALPSLCDTAYIQVVIGSATCANQAPIANNDQATVQDGQIVYIDALANDVSTDDLISTHYMISAPQHGIVSPSIEGFFYTPNNDYTGNDYFMYLICDDGNPSLCDTAYIEILVTPQAISAQPDIDYTNQYIPVTINVLANDYGTNIVLSNIITNPTNGQLTVNPNNGLIEYDPNEAFYGVDYFEYQICNESGECDITLVTIYVLEGGNNNVAPHAVNDDYIIDLGGSQTLDVLYNDTDAIGGNELTISSFTQPQNGTIVSNPNGTLFYTSTTATAHIDTFTYIVCDNATSVLCDTATVIIYVTNHTPALNNAPIALNDLGITQTNTPIYLSVLNNDTDVENDSLHIVWISQPANGIANISADSVQYVPASGFVGTDYLAYIICDNGNPSLCDTAYITIIVEGEPISVTYEINDTTNEDTPLTICPEEAIAFAGFTTAQLTITNPPTNGVVGIDTDTNCLTYVPNTQFVGSDSLLVNACNSNNVCFDIIIYLTVLPISDPPLTQNDTVSTTVNTSVNIDVLSNDTDPDNDLLTAVIISTYPSQSGASVQVNSDLSVSYNPPSSYIGTDSFAYVITDATGELSDTSWVFVSILDNTVITDTATITALDDTISLSINEIATIGILDNDQLSDNINNIAISIISSPTHGTISINLSGTLNYVPNTDFVGIDTAIYLVCGTTTDGTSICDTATVIITVTNTQPPVETCGNIKFASGFSPNGDGTNDLYLIEGADDPCITNATLTIYNRWGDIIYSTNNYQNSIAWNGLFNNSGQDATSGTYFFLYSYTQNETQKQLQGCVELKR